MTKTNYTRVEEALEKGLNDLRVSQIRKKTEKSDQSEEALTPKQLIIIIEQDILWLKKEEPKIYHTLGLKKKELEALIEKFKGPVKELTEEDYLGLKKVFDKVNQYRKENFEALSKEDQVSLEKQKHLYKRHNVKEEWVPLDTHTESIHYPKIKGDY